MGLKVHKRKRKFSVPPVTSCLFFQGGIRAIVRDWCKTYGKVFGYVWVHADKTTRRRGIVAVISAIIVMMIMSTLIA